MISLFMSQKRIVNEWLANASFQRVGDSVFCYCPRFERLVQAESRWQYDCEIYTEMNGNCVTDLTERGECMQDKVMELICKCGSPIFTVKIYLEGIYAREVVNCATCDEMLLESTGMRADCEEGLE